MKPLSFIFLLILVGYSCTDSPSGIESEGSVPNIEAPNFTLTTIDGENITLSDLRGKVVYLFFYGASCSHCRSNGPVTETQIYQPFSNNPDFVALGLDTWNQSVSQNQAFQQTTGINYPLLLNGRQTLVNFYGNASAYDRSVVISAEGIIVYQGRNFVNTDTQTVIEAIKEQLETLNP